MDIKARLARWPVIGTALAVQDRYGRDDAGQYAAAMAYFGFLSLFPLLLLAISVVGFVFANRPEVQAEIVRSLTRAVPGLGPTLREALNSVEATRAVSGVIGVAGLLFSGFRVIDAATAATNRVFRIDYKANVVIAKVRALWIMATLALLALAGAGAASLVGVNVSGPVAALFTVGGILVSLATDTVLFLVSYRLLAASRGPAWADLWPGALLAAVGWTTLKVIGSTVVASRIAEASAIYGPFGAVVGVFFLLYLAARLYLYGAEVNAVRCERRQRREHAEPSSVLV